MMRNIITNPVVSPSRVKGLVGAQQFVRWNWQGHLPRRFDKATGKWKRNSDEWEIVCSVPSEPMKGNISLLERYEVNDEHIKPKEVKRRKAERIIYERQHKRIDDLTKYIKFMRDHPDEFERGKKK